MRDQDFLDYRNGGSFEVFVKKTRGEWLKLAHTLLKYRDRPLYYDADDLVQIMLMACTRFVFEWDPKRGPSIKTHVVWRAIDKAKKYVFRSMRIRKNGLNTRAFSPGFERAFSTYTDRQRRRKMLSHTVEAYQEGVVVGMMAARHPLVRAFAVEKSAEDAAARVLGDQALRERYGIKNANTAARRIMRIVREEVAA